MRSRLPRENFAFETTLASRTFAPWIRDRIVEGYRVHVAFISVPSADVSVARVRERVSRGGHDVPEATVRQRFVRGLGNLFTLYMPVVTTWRLFDSAGRTGLQLIACSGAALEPDVLRPIEWKHLKDIANGG